MTTTINASTTSGLVQTADTSGSLQLQTANTAALTIDTSQNVGIGTASPSQKLDIVGTSRYTFNVSNSYTLLTSVNASVSAFVDSYYNASQHIWQGSGAERMRIDSSGNVLVGTASILSAGKIGAIFAGNTQNGLELKNSYTSNSGSFEVFLNSAGAVAGSINHTGTTTVSYATSSDYRLKENIKPMTSALDKIAQLNPVTYTWKSDGSDGQGFIAHELQAIVPDCVTGEKDAVDEEGNPKYQGIDTSFLVATLTKAIQELSAKVDAQQQEINALKGAV